jgi:hypothetical protein
LDGIKTMKKNEMGMSGTIDTWGVINIEEMILMGG